jgi:radical SAM protein with 4Fe4S-binding SPASM domain
MQLRNRYPLPDIVCGYGTFEEYELQCPPLWVHFPDRVEKVLAGRYDEILPVFTEFVPDLRCTFRCPTCPYGGWKKSKGIWIKDGQKVNPKTSSTSMDWETMRLLIDKCAERKVALLWTGGGDPTFNECFIDGIKYARSKGLHNASYTNGSLLNEDKINVLFDNKVAFLRYSIDDLKNHDSFHGYNIKEGYLQKVENNLKYTAYKRLQSETGTRCRISIIFDKRNVKNLIFTAESIVQIVEDVGGGIDDALIRPLIYYGKETSKQLGMDVLREAASLLNGEGEVRHILERNGIKVNVGFELFKLWTENSITHEEFWKKGFSTCLASGFFGQVAPDGKMYLCTEKNGDPEYEIGDLSKQSLVEIWQSEKRKQVLAKVNNTKCTSCPPRCRPGRLNRVFEQIEQKRKGGEMKEVIRWLEDLRRVNPSPPGELYPYIG